MIVLYAFGVDLSSVRVEKVAQNAGGFGQKICAIFLRNLLDKS
jgi:hypothetical protein